MSVGQRSRSTRPVSIVTAAALAISIAGFAVIAQPADAAGAPRPSVARVFDNRFHAPSGSSGGGTRITVTGAHFVHVRKVHFGVTSGTRVHVLSEHKLQVTVPAHPAGRVHVRVVTRTGISRVTERDRFDFQVRRALAGGLSHSCQADMIGNVRCWGDTRYGQAGPSVITVIRMPRKLHSVSRVVSVAAGWDFTCALLAGGSVNCWGRNDWGQLGNGTSSFGSQTAVQVVHLGKALAITAGRRHACALIVGGTVKCWGSGLDGELGDGGAGSSDVPVRTRGMDHVVDLDATFSDTCATRADGTEACWGESTLNANPATGLLPRFVRGIKGAVSTAVVDQTVCVVNTAHRVRCASSGATASPVGTTATAASSGRTWLVSGLTGVVRLTAGDAHFCAVVTPGHVYCWGSNRYGQVGNGSVTDATMPVAVTGPRHVVDITGGASHTLALGSDGIVWGWGRNDHAQLGDGTETDRHAPVVVA